LIKLNYIILVLFSFCFRCTHGLTANLLSYIGLITDSVFALKDANSAIVCYRFLTLLKYAKLNKFN